MRANHVLAGGIAGLSALCLSGAADAQLVVSNAATSGVSCSGGLCTTSTAKAVLNVTQLQNLLASSDVQLKPGALSQSIAINAAVFWSSAHRLTLDAFTGIALKKPIQVAGNGALTLTTNDGGSGGDTVYAPKANITFLSTSSSLIVNGTTYALESSLSALASAIAGNSSGHYALSKSYDAAADGTYAASPVPTTFNGIFDGLNNTLSNLKMAVTVTGNAGMFSETSDSAVIRNFTLAHIDLNDTAGQGPTVGGLVAESDGLISNVNVSGKVRAKFGRIVGGLAGHAIFHSVILNSHSSVDVYGVMVGSLVGDNQDAVVKFSSATGSVKVSPNAASSLLGGGLVGDNNGGTIEQSFATGNVSGPKGANLGGLVGENGGTVTACYATGNIKAGKLSYAGGIAAYEFGMLSQTYSTGAPTAKQAHHAGGALGTDFTHGDGSVADIYWDMTTSGITDPGQGAADPKNDKGVTGLTDGQLKRNLPDGFDSAIWRQKKTVNNGWPYLINNPPKK